MCLLQDHAGFIWVGTENGLFRYDGRNFVRFDTTDGLPSAVILALHQDSRDNLWVGTQAGMSRYTGMRFIAQGEAYSAGWFGLGAITSDAEGRVYFGSPKGLGVFEPLPNSQFAFRTISLPGRVAGAVHGVLVDKSGDVWFSSDTSLYRLKGGKVQDVGAELNVPKDQWDALTLDKQGTMWMRSRKLLLRRDAGQNAFRVEKDHLLHAGDAEHLATTAEGDLLVPAGPALLIFSDNKHWESLDQKQGVPETSISCVLQDHEGSVWMGTWGGGLYRWLGYSAWRSWTRQDGLSDSTVWQMLRDTHHTLWAATQLGLNTLDADQKRWHPVLPGGMNGAIDIRTLLATRGGLWLGMAGNGVWWWDEHHDARKLAFSPAIPNASVFKLTMDDEGRLWAATNFGLFRSTSHEVSARFEHQAAPSIEGEETFYDVHTDQRGRIWAAGTRGLVCFDHGKWRRIGKKDGLAADDLRGVSEDLAGRIWISYDCDRGVVRLTEGAHGLTLDRFTKENGLKSNDSNFLGRDAKGLIWSGTDNGLDVFNGSRWAHFGTQEGLWWADCDTNGFWADEDGTVWIGTSGGISRFRPRQNNSAPIVPGSAITSIASGAQQFSSREPFSVPYGSQPLEIGFSSLTFVNELDVRYRYRLQGLDDKWTDTSQLSVNYSHLPPGKYRFEVYARSGQGVWSAAPATIQFEVLTPWWMTLWFRLLTGLALGAAALSIYRWRVRNINLQNQKLRASLDERTALLEKANTANRLKNEFLANMSHEVRTPIHGLMAMVELTLDTELTSEQRENLMIIGDSASSLHSILNDVLDLSKIEANCMELEITEFDLPALIDSSSAAMQARAREKGLQLISNFSPEVPRLMLGDPTRLRQVLVNLLANAIKFTKQGGINVSVEFVADSGPTVELKFAVRDSGIGIAPESHAKIFEAFVQADGSMTRRFGGTGLGLSICSRLVQLMGGKIWVDSQPGLGSTFLFTAVFNKPEQLQPVDADVELALAGKD